MRDQNLKWHEIHFLWYKLNISFKINKLAFDSSSIIRLRTFPVGPWYSWSIIINEMTFLIDIGNIEPYVAGWTILFRRK